MLILVHAHPININDFAEKSSSWGEATTKKVSTIENLINQNKNNNF